MFKKKKKITNVLPIYDAVTVACEGIKEGRELPNIIVDASAYEEFFAMVELHKSADLPGDIITTWAWPKSRFSKPKVFLKMSFVAPVKFDLNIVFDPVIYGEIIDAIILSKLVTILHGNEDIITLFKNKAPAISIEIPSTSTFPTWEKIYLEALTIRYRKQNFKKKEAIRLAKERIKNYRKSWISKSYDGKVAEVSTSELI
ncbi:hypothetical protein TUM3794_03900 [Shewanella colwelliana]|uniref:Uncharacterized protein n=1 Tax=Shewanella colwelliana TaxID=23 RepID=A0ABQ4NVL9_SHECO|nr:hypothetical protein [Shewanella colwelliana]GIU35742.1 hypothetical protein TUM3794_03900 [Shewanella colwelliana]